VTTGTITGLVQDAQGGVLPGVTVTAVHLPTGTSYEGVTQGDGHYTLLNVRVGGPYQLTATLSGFRNAVIGDLNVRLGESTDVPVKSTGPRARAVCGPCGAPAPRCAATSDRPMAMTAAITAAHTHAACA